MTPSSAAVAMVWPGLLLAKNHGITNVAVLEKGWIGSGNTGRDCVIKAYSGCNDIQQLAA